MIKIYNINKFLISPSLKFQDILVKLEENHGDILFVIDECRRLVGSITDGDLRRANYKYLNTIQHCTAEIIMNDNPLFWEEGNDIINLQSLERKKFIPATDNQGVIKFLFSRDQPKIKLGKFEISTASSVFLVAEIGNNHQNNLDLAFALIDEAKKSGADCVKFQHRNMANLYGDGNNYDDFDLGSQYVYNLISKFQMSKNDLYRCFDYCQKTAINFTCTPFDSQSLQDLEDYGLDFYKISSADFLNRHLVEEVISLNKPFLISTGMATTAETLENLKFISSMTEQFIPLHCNSTYPAPYKDIQLNFMEFLLKHGNGLVGYSGHEMGQDISIAAVVKGAKVIERHFTLDKAQEGNDHKVSLLPKEFENLRRSINNVQEALNSSDDHRIVSQGEALNKNSLGKGLYASGDIAAGSIILDGSLKAVSPVLGIPVQYRETLIGKTLKRDIRAGQPFTWASFEEEVRPNWDFKNQIFIPVRHKDAANLCKRTQISSIEVHLSWSDLNLDPALLPWDYITDYSIHAPELFENDHIVDLASKDKQYREQSIKNLRRVIDFALSLKKIKKKNNKINIILNVGGASNKNCSPSQQEKLSMYLNVHESLSQLINGAEDFVNLCIQTMPPYPWHFGGQRQHNLFVDPKEIAKFCSEYKWPICLDTSHSMMHCNLKNTNFHEFFDSVAKWITHIHLADCLGADGEGIVTGKGNFDFDELLTLIARHHIYCPIVIEEWQGHMHDGAGFRNALKFFQSKGY